MTPSSTHPLHHEASEKLFERSRAVIPGGVNSPVRAFNSVGGTPAFAAKAKGAYLYDADGNEYVDLVCSWGPSILGHAHPQVVEAVQQAVLTEVQQQHLEQAISAYREEHATLQASLDRPAMRTVATLIEHGQKAPSQEELTRIRQERDNVEQQYETLMTREGIRTNGIETLESLFQDYQEQQGESAHAVEQANLYAGLARIARGDNPDKNHQIDLVSYVLGGEFEQVLQVASEHLQRMSDNRYRLVLSDKREKRARIGGGLSISVEDNWNNDQREVSSLSGGESFLASLSLALGLAEVVQARNGGIEIETLFIDEGFGTLDAQTLELVMETLENIRENGRVIGLISHVEDMKERISAQVSIEKRQNGSTLRVNV